AAAPHLDPILVEAAETRAVQRHLRLQRRDVDALAATGGLTSKDGGEHCHRRVRAGVEIAEIAPRLNRRPLWKERVAQTAGEKVTFTATVEDIEMAGAV